MSRIGRLPIELKGEIKIKKNESLLEINGPKGSLQYEVPESISVDQEGSQLIIKAEYKSDSGVRALMGTTRANIQNMVTGVSEGFKQQLNLVGVGYRASVQGQTLEMNLGYSHPIKYSLPKGITAKVNKNTELILEGCDKQLLGQVVSNIRSYRPPEPYKGKGILFQGEVVRRKAGKSGKK